MAAGQREKPLRTFRSTLLAALALLAGCSGGGRPTGPPLPVGDTIRTITGRLAYFTTGPNLSNFTADGRLMPTKGFGNAQFPTAAKYIAIEIVAPDGTVMGADRSGEDGRFSIQINFGENPATQVAVRATARIDLPFGSTAYVRPGKNAPAYSHTTPLGGNPSSSTMTIDLDIALNDAAAAYHILQTIYTAFVTAKPGINTPMPDLDLLWAPGNGDTSSFVAVNPARGELTIAGGILGDNSSNVDAWDPPKIMRLFGEYLFTYFFTETAPEGTPNDAKLVPSAAWREGFLDFWACVARNTSIYWDTVGTGAQGCVVRYFDIESFFDSTLGSLGPNDPNAYQDPSVIGLGSSFTVAEVLWDIHDRDSVVFNDNDGVDEFPLFITLQLMRRAVAGFSYPYLFTLLDQYVRDGSIAAIKLDNLMRFPEEQGLFFPATAQNDLFWPFSISPDSLPQGPITPPFDKTVSDMVDTLTPDPVNLEIGEMSQRYFIVDLLFRSDLTASLTTTGGLELDILDLRNNVLATGPSPLTATGLEPRKYIIRVRSTTDPQVAAFDLRVEVVAAP